jgi:acyl-CoA ligase (AMP-forming) (exosortase A-associated)
MHHLLHELIFRSADLDSQATALQVQSEKLSYAELAERVRQAARMFLALSIGRGERIAVYLNKRTEVVAGCFGASAAGAVFVPVNPLLKPEQVAYILRDCNVRILVTSKERLDAIGPALEPCTDLHTVVVTGADEHPQLPAGKRVVSWSTASSGAANVEPHRTIDADMAAILYTSGSTGRPKGVVLSHRNMVAGAYSVASYLQNCPQDRILSALPLSFDAGFSQLTTAFRSGASVVLIDYLLPRDVVDACARHAITGLTAVPPLWIQVAQLRWPDAARNSLRYFANTGGRMPRATLDALRKALPHSKPYLMYGLTEAFRSTYLPPAEVDRRPDSIGKAIPNAEIMVVRPDGNLCEPDEPGELVHRGALVSLGYWNDPEKTAERFRPAPGQPPGLVMPEIAVWSGDTVRRDADGFLYFVGRNDEMIKTSGYRVSPTEVEEEVYASGMVGEVAALGIPHPVMGQAIVVVVTAAQGKQLETDHLLAECRKRLPAFMVPHTVRVHTSSLPRNPNGKIDRRALAADLQALFGESP